jgi:2-polyprenyl-6-methoxyphenol hydroxylase-like FAD-dependent oxidoreductase
MNPTVEIIGGGLAGLALGLGLRRHGVPVIVYEAGHYPRHRVCGEFITGLDAQTMERLGLQPLLADCLHHRRAAWYVDGELARDEVLPEPALGLSRHALDARLADAFGAAGGSLRTGTRFQDDSAAPGRIWASGRRRGVSRWLGLKAHFTGLALTHDLELHLGDHAYVGLSAVEGGAVNVCGLFRRRPASTEETAAAVKTERAMPIAEPAVLLDHLLRSRLGQVAERVAAAEFVGGSSCAVAALSFERVTPIPDDRIQLGDAYEMTPPFTGNGMAIAFQSAAVALEPLVRYARGETEWRETCRVTNAAIRGRFRRRLMSADFLHPFLLRPRRQRWFARLSRARLLPFRPLYAAVH